MNETQTFSPTVALVGAGPMARAYAGPLIEMGVDTRVIGRGEVSAKSFSEATGLPVLTGGLMNNLHALDGCTHAVIATPVPMLATQARQVVEKGVSRVLVEKPAGMDFAEIEGVMSAANAVGAKVYVAYNRRFYAAVQEAKRRIARDGGATSFRFEISEWSERIAPSHNTDAVKATWFLANSTHVIDMAFFLGGRPAEIHGSTAGRTGWHSPAVFVGHGRTEAGALFSYHGDWNAAPRWMVEICTPGYTYMFNPLETLCVRTKAGFAIEDIELGNTPDSRHKPGVFGQLEAFLSPRPSADLLGIAEHAASVRDIYASMSGGAKR